MIGVDDSTTHMKCKSRSNVEFILHSKWITDGCSNCSRRCWNKSSEKCTQSNWPTADNHSVCHFQSIDQVQQSLLIFHLLYYIIIMAAWNRNMSRNKWLNIRLPVRADVQAHSFTRCYPHRTHALYYYSINWIYVYNIVHHTNRTIVCRLDRMCNAAIIYYCLCSVTL